MSFSSSSKKSCPADGCNSVGILKCEGCSQIFCQKHVDEHRDFLNYQLDEIALQHDTLQQMITEQKNKDKNYHPLLKQIDKWEQDSITKIQQTAKEARQQTEILFGSQKEMISKELHDLAEELEKARIDDDFVEIDLCQWTNMLEELKHNVNNVSSSAIINEDPTKLLVANIFVSSPIQQNFNEVEQFGKTFGNVCIAENGHLAYHCGLEKDFAFVRGMYEYSSGKYEIRFVMNKKNPTNVMSFDIISKSMLILNNKFNIEKSTFGLYSKHNTYRSIAKSPSYECFLNMADETAFEIELLLDCDNQRITYFNERTKNKRELNVNIRRCPFPWQILIYLCDAEDSVRLLSSKKLL
ncbi:unnamed protein product [Rotaria sordida]|uniref:B box-type domain-containing protein n=1 Tax=Rotaria sordida TaxID=392033 RepID=A0A815RZB2_9BILA|nr:unnamed protein product [Rotaria sordida]CAF1483404.1 unnamed protein product [Rotaria sordida]